MKLGRLKPTAEHKARALPLSRYVRSPLPPAPPSCCNSAGAPIDMFGNDRYGDCTFAALANYRAICSVKEGLAFPTTEADVTAAYLDFTHGKDDGAVEHDVLNLAKIGVKLGGSDPWRLAAWVTVDIADRETCRFLVSEFWSLYLGVELPNVAKGQGLWDATSDLSEDRAPGSWGGHALLWSDYEENGDVGLVTWGQVKTATPAWLAAYCDEAYVLLDEDRATSINVDWDALVSDMTTSTARP